MVFTLVQGTTLAALARLLGLPRRASRATSRWTRRRWSDLGADLLQVRIPAASRMHGVLVRELRLPAGAVLSLLVRDGQGMVPGPDTRLRRGDQLLVVTTSPARAAAERRLRAVGRAGRLAGWLGGLRRERAHHRVARSGIRVVTERERGVACRCFRLNRGVKLPRRARIVTLRR